MDKRGQIKKPPVLPVGLCAVLPLRDKDIIDGYVWQLDIIFIIPMFRLVRHMLGLYLPWVEVSPIDLHFTFDVFQYALHSVFVSTSLYHELVVIR